MLRKLAPALVAPLLLTACATRADRAVVVETGSAGVQALQAAPDSVAAAGTAAFELVISISGGDQTFEMTANGVLDTEARRMAMEMDLGSMLREVAESSGEVLPAGMDEPMRFVVDGDQVYIRMPMLDALTGTSGWLSASPEDLGQAGGSLGVDVESSDPSALLEMLRGVAGDVEEIGTADVRGVPTTGYRATISLAKALEEMPAEQREQMGSQFDGLDLGSAQLPVEVWVDDNGLPRRVTMTFGDLMPLEGLGAGGSMEMRMEFFDYGEPVTIEVPSPDEVTPMTEILGGFTEGFQGAGS